MHMAKFVGSAQNCPTDVVALELRWNGHPALLAGDGVAHN
jgi:hypothetical protein